MPIRHHDYFPSSASWYVFMILKTFHVVNMQNTVWLHCSCLPWDVVNDQLLSLVTECVWYWLNCAQSASISFCYRILTSPTFILLSLTTQQLMKGASRNIIQELEIFNLFLKSTPFVFHSSYPLSPISSLKCMYCYTFTLFYIHFDFNTIFSQYQF